MNLIIVHAISTLVLVSDLYLRGSISLYSFVIAIIIEIVGRLINKRLK